MERKWVFILVIEVDSFLTICLWSNNEVQDNRPIPSGKIIPLE